MGLRSRLSTARGRPRVPTRDGRTLTGVGVRKDWFHTTPVERHLLPDTAHWDTYDRKGDEEWPE